jgi:hypothetical protein
VPEDRDSVLIDASPMRLFGVLVGLLGVLEILPRSLLSRLVFLFLVGNRRITVSVSGSIVQLRRPLVFVM